MSSAQDARATQHRRAGFALALLVLVDLVWFRLVSGGREAAMRFSPAPSSVSIVFGLLVALVVLVHGGLGVVRAVREEGAFAYGGRDRRRLQWVTAFAIAPVLALRFAYGPLAANLRGLDGLGMHQGMVEEVGRPMFVVVQTFGVAALGLHFFQGIAAYGRSRGRPFLAPLAVALAATYVFLYVDTAAVFVVGRSLVPRL